MKPFKTKVHRQKSVHKGRVESTNLGKTVWMSVASGGWVGQCQNVRRRRGVEIFWKVSECFFAQMTQVSTIKTRHHQCDNTFYRPQTPYNEWFILLLDQCPWCAESQSVQCVRAFGAISTSQSLFKLLFVWLSREWACNWTSYVQNHIMNPHPASKPTTKQCFLEDLNNKILSHRVKKVMITRYFIPPFLSLILFVLSVMILLC